MNPVTIITDRMVPLWMTDIAEHPTAEGRVFCCAMLDAWSPRVVGWSVDRRATTAMVNSALGTAINNRRVSDTLVHSDHAPHYTSWTFPAKVRHAGLVHSLGSRNPRDPGGVDKADCRDPSRAGRNQLGEKCGSDVGYQYRRLVLNPSRGSTSTT